MMDTCELLDLPSTGGFFTWHRNCKGHRAIARKLDRALANPSWSSSFPLGFLEILCRLHSDHNPLLVRCGGLPEVQGSRPFRFEAAWIVHDEYQDIVARAWSKGHDTPVASLHHVRDYSISFNEDVFGNIHRRKRKIKRRLQGVQRALERVDSVRLVSVEQQLQWEYDQILFQEELHWYKKSCEKWVKLGDRNTKHFHAQTQNRRRRNKIRGFTLPNGIWCTDDGILQEEALQCFRNLFCSPFPQPVDSFPILQVPRLSDDMIQDLSHPVSKEEVSAALNHMHPYKSPGPDGFQGIFFKQY